MSGSTETYRKFAQYYDLYTGKYNPDLDFYISLCKKNDRILEIGCGTGRVMLSFIQNGFRITGIDISSEMLEVANQKLKQFNNQTQYSLSIHDLYSEPMKSEYDKALITFYTFNYIIRQPDIFLKNTYNSLSKKGLVVLDLFYPKSLIDKTSDNQWKERELKFGKLIVKLRDKRLFKNSIEYRSQVYIEKGKETLIDTERKYYSPIEIRSLLENTGFKNICFSTTFNKNLFCDEINETDLKTNFIVRAEKQT